ncbi:MAG: bifunctional DNA primase/polymerase [Limisphaerales bacterium]
MEEIDIVIRLRELLGDDVLLLNCRKGTKRPAGRWKNLTAGAMSKPAYLAKLGKGNIGVALGPRSGGLCSLDIDSDKAFLEFEKLNPEICKTLATRGKRGGNYWWRVRTRYPVLTPLKLNGDSWGEWRADGAQTIIWGTHPEGGRYSFLRDQKPGFIEYDQIKWPEGLVPPHCEVPQLSVTESPERPELPERTQVTQRTEVTEANARGKCVGVAVTTLDQALAAARALGPHQNHHRLFTLARGIKAVELFKCGEFSQEELRGVFDRWFAEARPFVRKELSEDDYWFEFMDAYDNALHPLGQNMIEIAWEKVSASPLPIVAHQFKDAGLQKVVSLCREMARMRGSRPFFISCRTIQRLLGHPEHVRAARWLRGLTRAKILAVVEAGEIKTRKATRYRYLPPL